MCHLMYKEVDIWAVLEEESRKLCPSRLEQVLLPLVFHTEEYNVWRARKVNATISDHSISKSQTRSRKMQDHHLVQLGGVVLPQCGVFLAT